MGFGALGLQELVGVVDQFSEGHLPGAVPGDLRKLPLAFLHAACLDRIPGRGKGADGLAMQDTVGSRIADPVDPAPRNFFEHTPGQTEGGGSGRQGGLCFFEGTGHFRMFPAGAVPIADRVDRARGKHLKDILLRIVLFRLL